MASIRGKKSHQIIRDGIQVLLNHWRTAARMLDDALPNNDGAGHSDSDSTPVLRTRVFQTRLPKIARPGSYGVGMTFFASDETSPYAMRGNY